MIARTSISCGAQVKVNEVYLRETSFGVAALSNGCLLFVSFLSRLPVGLGHAFGGLTGWLCVIEEVRRVTAFSAYYARFEGGRPSDDVPHLRIEMWSTRHPA